MKTISTEPSHIPSKEDVQRRKVKSRTQRYDRLISRLLCLSKVFRQNVRLVRKIFEVANSRKSHPLTNRCQNSSHHEGEGNRPIYPITVKL